MITLEEVLSPRNLLQAFDRVITNKGAPGVDGMTVDQCSGHFARHGASICAHIRQGTYIPFPVRRVDIPKPNGGTRMPGIPTVQDRVIQQAIAQILTAHRNTAMDSVRDAVRMTRSCNRPPALKAAVASSLK